MCATYLILTWRGAAYRHCHMESYIHVGDLDRAVGPSRTSALLRDVPMSNLGSLVKYTGLVLAGS